MTQIYADGFDLESANIGDICGELWSGAHEPREPGGATTETYGFLISIGFVQECALSAPVFDRFLVGCPRRAPQIA